MDPEKASEPRGPEAGHGGGSTGAGQPTPSEGGRPPRRVWPVALAVAAVLAVGGGTAWLLHGSSSDRVQEAARPSAAATPGAGASGAPVAPLKPGKGGPTEARGPQDPSPSADPAGAAPRSWTADGSRLTVWFWAGVCEKYAVRADESAADRVAVRVVVDKPAPHGQVCPMIAKWQSAVVELAKPLDGRAVVDAATGRELPKGSVPPVLPRPGAGTSSGGPVHR